MDVCGLCWAQRTLHRQRGQKLLLAPEEGGRNLPELQIHVTVGFRTEPLQIRDTTIQYHNTFLSCNKGNTSKHFGTVITLFNTLFHHHFEGSPSHLLVQLPYQGFIYPYTK